VVSAPERASALARLSIFAALGEDALEAVARRTVERTLARGAQLFRKGEPCRGLHVVLEGRVKVYRASPDGQEQVLHTQGPGQALAEVPLFDGGPYPASAEALEESRLLFLSAEDFQWLYQHHPEIAGAVIRELGRRLRRMVGLVEKLSLNDVPTRVAQTLVEFAEAAGALEARSEFRLPRTQQELAAELGTSRESVARALAKLRQEGVIAQNGPRIAVLDERRLRAAASPR
jgi:CRP/FNR family transcriptional regulator